MLSLGLSRRLRLLRLVGLFLPLSAGYRTLSLASLRALSQPTSAFALPAGTHLAPLLHPRVPGTAGSESARAHISDFFSTRLPSWTLTWHNSTSRPPTAGRHHDHDHDVPFVNMILQRDPPGSRHGSVERLMLAAHYDTLPGLDGFVGAVDSAASCAVLMRVAELLDGPLTEMWRARANGGDNDGDDYLEPARGLQVVFFDGEEAWDKWSDDDSLYGSRSLAEKWASEEHPPGSAFRTPLESISLLVLLDLLGAPGSTVPSYFPNTHWAYQSLARVETLMRENGLLDSDSDDDEPHSRRPFLVDADTPAHRIGVAGHGTIADDHVPFMQRGVDVVHLIPHPFPWEVWHRIEDDGDHLDLRAVNDWAKILAGFVGGWMEVEAFVRHHEGKDDTDDKDDKDDKDEL